MPTPAAPSTETLLRRQAERQFDRMRHRMRPALAEARRGVQEPRFPMIAATDAARRLGVDPSALPALRWKGLTHRATGINGGEYDATSVERLARVLAAELAVPLRDADWCDVAAFHDGLGMQSGADRIESFRRLGVRMEPSGAGATIDRVCMWDATRLTGRPPRTGQDQDERLLTEYVGRMRRIALSVDATLRAEREGTDAA